MKKAPKYKVNENYFEKIDSEEKSYILGCLIARAGMNKYSINFYISNSDVKTIQLISQQLGETTQKPNQKNTLIAFYNIKMIKDLEKIGLEKNNIKNSIINFNLIDEKLHKHFIRGFFEASLPHYGRNNDSIRLFGNQSCMRMIEKFLIENKIKPSTIGMDTVKITSKDGLIEFKNVLYCNANVFSEYHLNKLNNVVPKIKNIGEYLSNLFKNKKHAKIEENKENIIKYYNAGNGYKKVAKLCGLPKDLIRDAYKYLGIDNSNGPPKNNENKNCSNCKEDKIIKLFRKRGTYINNTCFKCETTINQLSLYIKAIIRGVKPYKTGQYKNFVKYDLLELRKNIEDQFESWMSWNNWKSYDPKTWDDNDCTTWTWNLDHIIPHIYFKYTEPSKESYSCWSLENLRPYSAKQNIIEKHNRFEKYPIIKKYCSNIEMIKRLATYFGETDPKIFPQLR